MADIAPSKTAMIHAKVMDLKSKGFEILSLCVGEPDFAPPGQIISAAKDALDSGHTKYTANNGSLELREAICAHLSERKGVSYDPSCILVTNGGSCVQFQTSKLLQATLNLTLVREQESKLSSRPLWLLVIRVMK